MSTRTQYWWHAHEPAAGWSTAGMTPQQLALLPLLRDAINRYITDGTPWARARAGIEYLRRLAIPRLPKPTQGESPMPDENSDRKPYRRDPTTQEKLQLAGKVNELLDRQCEELGVDDFDAAEVLVLAIYARTNPSERSALFINGLK